MNICTNTKFLFIITSSDKIEDRFLYDAEKCIHTIHGKGVQLNDILIATDSDNSMILAKCPSMRGATFITSQQLLHTINTLECDNLIILTDCHRSINGIDAKSQLKPQPFTEAIKSNPFVKNVVVFFGQCYAGIYNWVDVRQDEKNIIYLGATGFDSSLSYGVAGIPWSANISLIAFFKWLLDPKDIDGDGSFTVMDLFKYIAIFTNNVTNDIEKQQTADLVDAKVELKLAMKEKGRSTDAMTKLEKEAIEALENYIVPHQDPWLLNAFSAQQVQFE